MKKCKFIKLVSLNTHLGMKKSSWRGISVWFDEEIAYNMQRNEEFRLEFISKKQRRIG